MTVHNIAPKVAELPEPQFPMLTRVVSDSVFSERKEELVWIFGQPHPFAPKEYRVFRMFANRSGVEIYSVSFDGKSGIRDSIPMSKVRFLGEEMSDTFLDELYDAEDASAPVGPLSDEDDDDDDDDEPEEPEEIDNGPPALSPDQITS